MFRFKKRNLSATPLYTSIMVIVLMAGGLGAYSAISKYKNYKAAKENIVEKFNKDYRSRLVEEMDVVIDFIDYKKKLAARNLEAVLQQKVQTAYVTASHIYSFNKGKLPEETIKTMIIETLRPIRWNTNQGYYFIGNVDTGRILLMASEPSMEGDILYDVQDTDGKYVTREIISTVIERGAGLVTYKWKKPGNNNDQYLKSSFVKYFMPYNWYIGAGDYLDEVEKQEQNDVLKRIDDMKFARFGSIACIRGDGQTLVDFESTKNGRLVTSIKDDSGQSFGREVFNIANINDKKGFVKSLFYKPGSDELTPRLSYIHYFKQWDWILVTSLYEDEMIAAIQIETDKFRQSTIKDLVIFASFFVFTMVLVFSFALYYSRRLKNDISLFTDFFRKTAYHKIPLEEKDLTFMEFLELGEFANTMVEDRNKAENLLRRDELRFNTLYQISKMKDVSFDQMCEFALERTLALSTSEAGYICLLNGLSNRADIICMRRRAAGERLEVKRLDDIEIEKNSSAYKALEKKTAVRNRANRYHNLIAEVFKDLADCSPTLDVPVSDGEKIVAIAGVCNGAEGYYDELDEQQVSVVYEGVWHHYIRERDEKEKRRLKNLLESINDSMSSMIIGVDENCQVIQWNRQAERCTGIKEISAMGKFVGEALPRLQNLVPVIQKVINSGVPEEIHNAEWSLEDNKNFEDISVFPLVGDQLHGAVIRIDDVTERVYMEDIMIQSEKMLSVGGLAAGIAHEINNPLAGIIQTLQVARRRLTNEIPENRRVAEEVDISLENLERYIKKRKVDTMFNSIASSAESAASLVTNMLNFSRKSDSVFSSTDIVELMENTVDLVSKDYDLKKNYDFNKIKLIRRFEGKLSLIPCEKQNIQQVFFNILKNGGHALYEKSFKEEEPQIIISIEQADKTIVVTIEDNGPGIDEERIKRIFEPFFTTKPVGIGTGLGLSISYFIINEQHGGSLEVRSTLDEGTAFVIKLPCEREALSSQQERVAG